MTVRNQSHTPGLGTLPNPPIRFGEKQDLSQDQEWFETLVDGKWRRLRLHDYGEIYRIPGLYETLFDQELQCNSPERVASLLEDVLSDFETNPEDLRVLDLGAGNGMVGEALKSVGAGMILGADVIEEAKDAAERDRPWCYDDYFVADFTDLPSDVIDNIREQKPNTLTCVAALGFGDIPVAAFTQALDLIEVNGWVAFNIKEDFLRDDDTSGFGNLIQELMRTDVLQVHAYRRYQHRVSSTGRPLFYVAIVARKLGEVPGRDAA